MMTPPPSTRTAAANLPSGAPTDFGGTLTELRSTSNRFGMYFDPTSLAIPTDLIESITFRIYLLEGGNNTFRMAFPGASDWLVLYAPTGAGWCEYTIYADGRGFSNDQKPTIATLANADGTLGPWGIAVKYPTSATEDVCYIDNVTITLKKDDGIAPVINYAGGTELLTSAGKPFVLDATAYDEGEGRDIPLVFEWSEGAIDSDGLLVMGEHLLTVSATDLTGNVTVHTVIFHVVDVIADEFIITAGNI